MTLLVNASSALFGQDSRWPVTNFTSEQEAQAMCLARGLKMNNLHAHQLLPVAAARLLV